MTLNYITRTVVSGARRRRRERRAAPAAEAARRRAARRREVGREVEHCVARLEGRVVRHLSGAGVGDAAPRGCARARAPQPLAVFRRRRCVFSRRGSEADETADARAAAERAARSRAVVGPRALVSFGGSVSLHSALIRYGRPPSARRRSRNRAPTPPTPTPRAPRALSHAPAGAPAHARARGSSASRGDGAAPERARSRASSVVVAPSVSFHVSLVAGRRGRTAEVLP